MIFKLFTFANILDLTVTKVSKKTVINVIGGP
jgi:hypothetical protein